MKPLYLAKDVFALNQLGHLQTSDNPHTLIALATKYDAEGDEELAYVHYRRHVHLVASIRRATNDKGYDVKPSHMPEGQRILDGGI